MDTEELERKLFGSHEKAVEFCEALQNLAKIWQIWGFKCSGQSYITNQVGIGVELVRRKERHGT